MPVVGAAHRINRRPKSEFVLISSALSPASDILDQAGYVSS
jgi:hypothetical protein